MKQTLLTLVFFVGLTTITTAQTTPEELGKAVIQSFIDEDENAFYKLIPTCDEIISYIETINLLLSDSEVQAFQKTCPKSTNSFKNAYLNNYRIGIQKGIDWKKVIIDEISSFNKKADEFEFDVTYINIIAHYQDRLIEISIKNAFAVNGSWKLNDKFEFSF